MNVDLLIVSLMDLDCGVRCMFKQKDGAVEAPTSKALLGSNDESSKCFILEFMSY